MFLIRSFCESFNSTIGLPSLLNYATKPFSTTKANRRVIHHDVTGTLRQVNFAHNHDIQFVLLNLVLRRTLRWVHRGCLLLSLCFCHHFCGLPIRHTMEDEVDRHVTQEKGTSSASAANQTRGSASNLGSHQERLDSDYSNSGAVLHTVLSLTQEEAERFTAEISCLLLSEETICRTLPTTPKAGTRSDWRLLLVYIVWHHTWGTIIEPRRPFHSSFRPLKRQLEKHEDSVWPRGHY